MKVSIKKSRKAPNTWNVCAANGSRYHVSEKMGSYGIYKGQTQVDTADDLSAAVCVINLIEEEV